MLLDRMQITQARIFLVNRFLLPHRHFYRLRTLKYDLGISSTSHCFLVYGVVAKDTALSKRYIHWTFAAPAAEPKEPVEKRRPKAESDPVVI